MLENNYGRVLELVELEVQEKKKGIPDSGVSLVALAVYTRQLSVLLRSGISLPRALEVVSQGDSPALNMIFMGMSADIDRGQSLSKSMKRFPRAFNAFYVTLIEAAEVSGNLESNLGRLTEVLERNVRISRRITGAFAYPVAVAVVSVIVLGIFTYFILPTMVPSFEQVGVELPLITRVVLGFSQAATNPIAILTVVGLAIFAYRRFSRWYTTREGRMQVQRRLRKIPVAGPTMVKQEAANILYLLSTLLDAGVDLGHTLRVAENAGASVDMSINMYVAQKLMMEGGTFTSASRTLGMFPEVVLKLVEVGEETGRLGEMMRCAVRLFEEEIDHSLSRVSSLLEPLIMVVVGIIVGIVTLAAFLPSISMMNAL